MNLSEEKIIDAIKDGASALLLAKEIKSDMKTEFYSLKESIRFDMQNIIAKDVKLAIREGLEHHYNTIARPHIEKVSEKTDAVSGRVFILESHKDKQSGFLSGISWLSSAVYTFGGGLAGWIASKIFP